MTMTTMTLSAVPAEDHMDQPAPADAYCDDGHLLLLLVTWWEMATGRSCPAWPLTDVPPDALIGFWADPDMEDGR